MPITFAGLRGTGSWGDHERPTNFREAILWLNPNGSAPLTALLSKTAEEAVDDPQFSWFEEKLEPLRVRINFNAGFSTTDTTLTIAGNGLLCVPGMVFQVERSESTTYDNEHIMISSVTSDTQIVVKRGVAGTGAAPIPNNTWLTCLGTAYPEGTDKPAYASRNPIRKYNYCQIFETAMGITWTAQKTYARTGDPWKNEKRRKMFDHAVQMEFAFIFGKPYEDTSGPQPVRFTGGLRHFIETNVTIFTTTPTEDTFLNAVYRVFDYDTAAGNERIVLAGNGALNSLNKLARGSGRIQFNDVVRVYGMQLQRWVLPQGTLLFRSHPLFNVHPRYTYSMIILDPTSLKYRYLYDTKFVDNVQTPGKAAREALWYTEAGLEVQHESTNGYIGNFVV